MIVDIDERSLAEIGQWPWPRTTVARLVDRLSQMGAVVIGFDIVFSEPDRMSPGLIAGELPGIDDGTRTVLYLRNGTLVNVVGRKVAGTDGQEASHLKQAGDTLDVRQIKAVIEYDGKHYLAEARWLKFFFGTAGIGKFSNAYKQKWVVRDGKLQNVSILHQGDRIVE